jgi:small subunit ribosomal protein S6
MDGFLVFTDDWGERKLAYDIKKRTRGYYVRFDYCGLSPLVDEIERFFRIDDRALKYMTVLLDKAADLEKIKEEKAEAASKAAIEKAAQEASQEVETAPVEGTATVEEETQKDVAPTSDESDSAADTTPLKNPEEA